MRLSLTLVAALLLMDATAGAQPAPAVMSAPSEVKAGFDLATKIVLERQAARYSEARSLAERAFSGGQVEAGNLLSIMLHHGLGGVADLPRAKAVRAAAAKAGSVSANLTLADAHLKGTGGYRKDAGAAFRYLSAAANADEAIGDGRHMAQWRLAMMLREGVGVRKDHAQAYAWVVRASDGGNADAMISRAVMLATGEGVAADPVAARRWYEAASLVPGSNHAHALRGLGGMLAFGQGGPVDLPRALAYLAIAKVRGDRAADTLLNAIRPRITDAMRTEADAIMRKWLLDERKVRPGQP